MIALTYVSKGAYKSMLKDSELPTDELQKRYGAGVLFRLQGILSAVAVNNCASNLREIDCMPSTADDLYDIVMKNGYGDDIYEINNLTKLKPKGILHDSLIYSMCQAETGDYGEEDDDE